MASLLSPNHYFEAANNFLYNVGSSNSAHYFYVAKPQPWTNTSGGDDDTAWRAPNNSVSQVELDVYDDMLFGKLITGSDLNRVIPKYEWVSNTVYSQYDQNDSSLYSKNFYVVTTDVNDEYNVYKCIDNNSNTLSTIKPTLQNTVGTFKTGDGYTWKYMYTVDVQANTRFTTTGFLPVVSNSAVQGNSIPGTIDAIRISNGGIGYSVYETGILDSVIDRFTIKLPGSSSPLGGYYTNSSIYFKSGFGAGQVREIDSYSGITKNITLIEPIDTFLRLDFSNTDLITGGNPGETVRQVVDTVTFSLKNGFLNTGANLVQTDTGVSASVLSSNSTTLRLSRQSTAQFLANNFVIRDTSSSGSLTTDKVNISNTTGLTLGVVVIAGTGYTENATITIVSSTGAGAVANAQANSSGKIAIINIANSGTGYTTEPTVTIAAPVAQSFDANTDVSEGVGEGANNVIAISTAQFFVQGDAVRYSVASSNSVIGGLANNGQYFIQFANATVVALSNTSNTAAGNRIALTKGPDETGHFLQGATATARILPRGLYITNAAAGAIFTSEYATNNFIRVGENSSRNIRVVQSVNSTVIVVDRLFANTITSANAFNVSTGVLISSVSISEANAVITDSNLDNIRLEVANQSIAGQSFIIGERVAATSNSANAVGVVVFSNTSSLFLSDISGAFASGLEVRGSSSNLVAEIVTVTSSPSITVRNPSGTFQIGENLYFNTSTGSNTGFGQLINTIDLSKFGIEYEIAPTVKIEGDGSGAIAIATVNTQVGMSNSISAITVLDPGSNYTKANITVYANSLYGTGASVTPVISPVLGHGSDPESELGSRHVCLDMNLNTLANENWYYPSNTSFRKFGVIKDPKFANITFETSNYTSFFLTLSNTVGTWTTGELVTQNTTNAAGFVVGGNTSIVAVRNTIGTFLPSYSIFGYTSGTTANVTNVQVSGFSFDQVIVQPATGASARVVSVVGSTLNLTDIQGKFVSTESLACLNSCAEASIDTILRSGDSLNVTSFFTQKFNQTARIALAANTGLFNQFEYITQSSSNASGRVINTTTDLDMEISISNGTFAIGDSITNSNTSANAKVIFANSTYLKVTAVSNNNLFFVNNDITTPVGGIASITEVYPVLIVSDVSKSQNFQSGINQIVGANSGSVATILSVVNPDLIRETGKVVYMESSENVITKDINTTERVRVVIKF